MLVDLVTSCRCFNNHNSISTTPEQQRVKSLPESGPRMLDNQTEPATADRRRWLLPQSVFSGERRDPLQNLILCELQCINPTQYECRSVPSHQSHSESRDENYRSDMVMFESQQKLHSSFAEDISRSPFRSLRIRLPSAEFSNPFNKKSVVNSTDIFIPVKDPVATFSTPGLQDDFYLNLLDWSMKDGLLAVGLQCAVVIWKPDEISMSVSPNTMIENEFMTIPENALRLKNSSLESNGLNGNDSISAIAWNNTQLGNDYCLALGRKSGNIELWDIESQTIIRVYHNHQFRVGVMDWFNGNLLSSGSRDKSIIHRDIRAPGDSLFRWEKHKQEICGLRWCPIQVGLSAGTLVSGGNDNNVFVWQLGYDHPIMKLKDHGAAVKALSWCPYARGILATGGGTNDRCIRLWDIRSTMKDDGHNENPDNMNLDLSCGKLLDCVESGSQVCNLMWSRSTQQLISTHGFTLNEVVVWDLQFNSNDESSIHESNGLPSYQMTPTLHQDFRFPSFNFYSRRIQSNSGATSVRASISKKDHFKGHSARILYATMNPSGSLIATGAGDETICMWSLFPSPKNRLPYNRRHS